MQGGHVGPPLQTRLRVRPAAIRSVQLFEHGNLSGRRRLLQPMDVEPADHQHHAPDDRVGGNQPEQRQRAFFGAPDERDAERHAHYATKRQPPVTRDLLTHLGGGEELQQTGRHGPERDVDEQPDGRDRRTEERQHTDPDRDQTLHEHDPPVGGHLASAGRRCDGEDPVGAGVRAEHQGQRDQGIHGKGEGEHAEQDGDHAAKDEDPPVPGQESEHRTSDLPEGVQAGALPAGAGPV
jgi:hypothetical protein